MLVCIIKEEDINKKKDQYMR